MKKMMIIFSVAALSLTGCYPGGPEDLEDFDIVLTNYAPEFDFQSDTVTTFTLPTKVVKIGDDGILDPDGNGQPDYISDENSKLILDEIKANMIAKGWTYVADSSQADLVILASAMETTTLYYYYDYWYYGWYYPYYPGGGWYYPGYYPPTYVSGYTTGTLLIQSTWPEGAGLNVEDKVPVVWSCVINGLLEGSQADLAKRVTQSIDQSFAQSPYLQK
jgi:hypothetical protein